MVLLFHLFISVSKCPLLTFCLDNTNFLLCVVDIQLDVKGFRDVYASFDNYVKVERLEGDNKYGAEQNGLQVS